MVWRRSRLAAVLAAAVLVGCFAAGAPVLRAASTVWLITFSIDNDDPAYAVAGDGLGAPTEGAPGVYKDYRLSTGQPDDINYCVEASPASAQHAHGSHAASPSRPVSMAQPTTVLPIAAATPETT